MKVTIAQSVGVDISKDWLDVALTACAKTARFANDPKGCRAMIKWLGAIEVERVDTTTADEFEPPFAHGALTQRSTEKMHSWPSGNWLPSTAV